MDINNQAFLVVNISDLENAPRAGVLTLFPQPASINPDNMLFLVDPHNHRILKYDGKGAFLGQIGQIGRNDGGFNFPASVYVKNDHIVTADSGNHRIKVLDAAGALIKSIPYPTEMIVDTAILYNDHFYLGALIKDKKEYNKKQPVMILDEKGSISGYLGRGVQCASYESYLTFNQILLTIANGKLYGAFIHTPVYFCIDLKTGRELYCRNALEDGNEVIRLKHGAGVAEHADQPMKIQSRRGIASVIYFEGLAADAQGRVYLSINHYADFSKSHILQCDHRGEAIKKIRLRAGADPLTCYYHMTADNKELHVVASDSREKLLLLRTEI